MDYQNKTKKTIRDVMAEHGGRLQLDLSKQEHKEAYYHHLGITDEIKKEKMKEKYPALYQAIENFSRSELKNENIEDDYQNLYNLYSEQTNLLGSSSNCISSVAKAGTTEKKSLITVQLDIYNEKKDSEHQYPFFTDNDYECDTQELLSRFSSNPVIVDEPTQFTAIATYTTVDQQGNLDSPECAPLHIAVNKNPIVDTIEVYHPKRLYSATIGQCIVCYNRAATPEDKADYSYQNVIIDEKKQDKKLSVHLPFAGTVKLNPNFTFGQFLEDQTEIMISIDGQEGQCSYPDKKVFQKIFQIKDHVLYWNFKEDRPCKPSQGNAADRSAGYDYENWNNTLLAKRVSNNVTVSFYAKIAFTVRMNNSNKFIPSHVIISSKGYNLQSSSTKEIDHICLWWGCLAGHTKILMADGTRIPISEIIQGDRIRLADGHETSVTAVLSGREEKVIHIVTQKHELQASDMHPIMTKRGLIRAKDLNAADWIAVENGYESLLGAYEETYQDLVYSLRTEDTGNIIADGIITGDFDAQQLELEYERQPEEWRPYHANPVADDLAMLFAHKKPIRRESVENMAAKPYYACYFEDGSESCAVLKLKDSGVLHAGAFSLEFWVNIQGESRELFSQESGFRIMIDSNTVIVQVDESHVFAVSAQVNLRHTWNQIFLASDGKVLRIGINGFETDCFDIDCNLFDPDCDLIIGRHFSGYIRRVILYRECIDASTLRLRMFQNICSDDMEHLAVFLDGVTARLEDIGPARLEVIRRASCQRVSAAGGFVPEKGHGAYSPNGGWINPGGLEGGNFSVYVKCYILPYSNVRSVLWSNGSFGEANAALLYFERELDGDAVLKMEYGGNVFDTGAQVPAETWQDLIVSYDASSGRMAVYQNGSLANEFFSVEPLERKDSGRFCLGNGWEGTKDYPADVLFTTAAVYSVPIGGQKAAQLYGAQPFVFDPQVIALFGFENGNGREYISGQDIYTSEAEQVLYHNISTYPLSAEHYWYDIDVDTSEYCLDAEKVFQMFAAYMKAVFGIAADSMNEEYTQAACWHIGKTMLNRPHIVQALAGHTDDETLYGVILDFHEDMEKLLNLTYANHPYNRVKSRMADKMGMNSILASVCAIVSAGEYAVFFEPEELGEALEMMRRVLFSHKEREGID